MCYLWSILSFLPYLKDSWVQHSIFLLLLGLGFHLLKKLDTQVSNDLT